jgi:hypothetical protein
VKNPAHHSPLCTTASPVFHWPTIILPCFAGMSVSDLSGRGSSRSGRRSRSRSGFLLLGLLGSRSRSRSLGSRGRSRSSGNRSLSGSGSGRGRSGLDGRSNCSFGTVSN